MPQIQTNEDIKQLGSILLVWAHPDDESFVATGIMMAAIANGQKVACLTATKGEIGVQDPAKWSADGLDDVRAKEMSQALSIVGCTNHAWMGYSDGQCAKVDRLEASEKIKEAIADINPDTIITFGPDGWTGHTDHRAVSGWVSQAVADSQIVVYHAVLTPEHYRRYFKKVDAQINIFYKLKEPILIPEEQCEIAFSLPRDLCNRKCAALAAHRSQTEALFESFDHKFLCQAFGKELFIRSPR